jgi:hypothetical protein
MAIVNLPLLDDSAPALEGQRVARENQFSGIVTTDGTRFWIHRFQDLIEAVGRDPRLPLKQTRRSEAPILHTREAVADGLDFADPNPAVIENYLIHRGNELVITGIIDNLRTARRAVSLLMLQKAVDAYVAVKTKSYQCSMGNEVIDEDELPIDGKCTLHSGGEFKEV